eukprot:3427266-Prymnesium_polylepis.2
MPCEGGPLPNEGGPTAILGTPHCHISEPHCQMSERARYAPVEDLAAVRELDALPRVLPPLGELLAVVDARDDRHGRAEGPHGRHHKVLLVAVGVLHADVLRREQALEEVAERLREREVEHRHER